MTQRRLTDEEQKERAYRGKFGIGMSVQIAIGYFHDGRTLVRCRYNRRNFAFECGTFQDAQKLREAIEQYAHRCYELIEENGKLSESLEQQRMSR